MLLVCSRIRLSSDNGIHATDAAQAAYHLRLLAWNNVQNVELISICGCPLCLVNRKVWNEKWQNPDFVRSE